MGSVHNEISRGGFLSAVKTALGGHTGMGGIERYSETMQPVMDVWTKPEWEFLRNETRFGGTAPVSAVVGQLGFAQLFLPPGTRTVCVIEDFWGWAPGAGGLFVMNETSTAAGIIAGSLIPADGRHDAWGGIGTFAQTQLRTGTSAAEFGAQVSWHETTATVLEAHFRLPITLTPGRGVHVMEIGTANALRRFGCVIRERPALPGELD